MSGMTLLVNKSRPKGECKVLNGKTLLDRKERRKNVY